MNSNINLKQTIFNINSLSKPIREMRQALSVENPMQLFRKGERNAKAHGNLGEVGSSFIVNTVDNAE